jgi:hypothetical protein
MEKLHGGILALRIFLSSLNERWSLRSSLVFCEGAGLFPELNWGRLRASLREGVYFFGGRPPCLAVGWLRQQYRILRRLSLQKNKLLPEDWLFQNKTLEKAPPLRKKIGIQDLVQ